VLQQLEQQFTLFTEEGVPVRAKLSCTFKEWWTNYEDLNKQAPESSDIAKMHIVKRGDTLSSIAAEEYLDPKLWRPIAIENGIDNPHLLKPGTLLLLPALTDKSQIS
ncbi:MAG TPA: LysM peptidoglycan-binding domain-containing protein, partial [Nitrosomonas sp.]|nr:LysM peptidoglycan-binding domain-containing protein [Nitrosomonas sp.]